MKGKRSLKKMKPALFEHVNVTVSDPKKTAAMLVDLFGWHVRWEGPSKYDGYTVHVGTDDEYIALYALPKQDRPDEESYYRTGAVNHFGILVEDLDATEKRILASGIKTHSHQTYDPGSRFYFHDHDGIEWEVVSYA
ncbi:glyoxalase family protein [Hyphomonas jannaschiana VP2]|uniref:Glyoxalase family protein n=2 Tax=Hyphomonas jannaschiana TaxID=86 RepID=A0A059FBW7_9PROT|nr:glyoxalase family protein [Hyphomonas jannaschiana VP2]